MMVLGKISALFRGNKNTNSGTAVAGRDLHIGDKVSNDMQLFVLTQAGYVDGLHQSKQQLAQQIQIFSSMPIKDEQTLHALGVALRQVEEKLADTEAAYELAQREGNQLAKVLIKMNEQHPDDQTLSAIKALGNKGNTHQADRVLGRAIRQDEANIAEKYYWRGKIAGSHFDLDKKREYFSKAAELDPKNMAYLEAVAEVEMDFDLKKAVLYTQRLVVVMRGAYAAQPLLLAGTLSEHARKLEDIGHYSEAIVLAEEATTLVRREYGNTNPAIADYLHTQARLYRLQGRYDQAETLFREELELRRSVEGKSERLASTLNSLAVLLNAQGRYQETEPLYLEALAIWREMHGEEHQDVALGLDNLAGLYKLQGRYEAAEPLYQQALTIRQVVLGEQHPNTALSLNNLADLYKLQGRYEAAEPLHQQALTIRQTFLGEQHPDTAYSLGNLADLYKLQGRYEAAEPLHQQALAIRQTFLGEQHPDTAYSLNNLACLYHSQGRYEAAEPLYQQALTISKAALGEQHPNTQRTIDNLKQLQQAMENQKQQPLSDVRIMETPTVRSDFGVVENPYKRINQTSSHSKL